MESAGRNESEAASTLTQLARTNPHKQPGINKNGHLEVVCGWDEVRRAAHSRNDEDQEWDHIY